MNQCNIIVADILHSVRLILHDAFHLTDSFLFTSSHGMSLKTIRYESTSLNRRSRQIIIASCNFS